MSIDDIGFENEEGFTAEEMKQITEEIMLMFAVTEGSMPMNRWLGLSPELLDKGMLSNDNAVIAEIIDKLEGMDSRISVTKVTIEHDESGEARTKVVIERRESQ